MRTATKRPRPRPRTLVRLLLCLPLAAAIGCGDDTVRGAGSIDIPPEALPRFPLTKPDFKAAKARGNAHRSR